MATLLSPKRTGRPCRNCGTTLKYSGYNCVECTRVRADARKATPQYRDYAKRYWMKKRHGITPEEFVEMLAGQGGVCGCCGANEPGNANGWVLDHDHATGETRSVLCHGCNIGLGAFRDSTERLAMAVAYLDSHQVKQSRTCKDERVAALRNIEPVPSNVNTSRSGSPCAVVARSGFCKRGHSMADAIVENRKSRPPSLRCRTCSNERRTALREERRIQSMSRKGLC